MNKWERLIIKSAVLNCLRAAPSLDIPINIKTIARAFPRTTCRVIPYSRYMRDTGMNYDEMLEWAGSEDAFSDYFKSSNEAVIAYNDIDESIMESNRYRWNIAHELGHIALEHHERYESSRLFRNTMTTSEYKQAEQEADYFASYILAPYAVLKHIPVESLDELMLACKISESAAKCRFDDYKSWCQNNKYLAPYDFSVFTLFRTVLENKTELGLKCKRCGTRVRINQGHCMICRNLLVAEKSHRPIFIRLGLGYVFGRNHMVYKGIELDDNLKSKICPHCENEESYASGEFCVVCGKRIMNVCVDTPGGDYSEACKKGAETALPGNARFCPFCGNETSFYQQGFLKAWDYKEDSAIIIDDTDELPF